MYEQASRELISSKLNFNEIFIVLLLKKHGIKYLTKKILDLGEQNEEIELFDIKYSLKNIREQYKNDSLTLLNYFEMTNKRLEHFGI